MTTLAALTDVSLAALAAGDRLRFDGSVWQNIAEALEARQNAAAIGTVVAEYSSSMTAAQKTAALQAAVDTIAAAPNNARPRLYIPQGAWELTAGVGHIATAGARLKNVVIECHPDAIFSKNAAAWPTAGTDPLDNGCFVFGYIDGFTFIGGQIDGSQTVTPGTIVNFNAGSAGDGIRLFSTSRVVFEDTVFRNCADSFLRITPLSTDPNPELHQYCLLDNIETFDCNQFSTTNSSGNQKGIDFLVVTRSKFTRGNSFKLAQRAGGTKFFVHTENVYRDFLSPLELDGVSNVISRGNRYENATQRAIQLISNNTNAATDFTFSHIDIDDECYNCLTGVVLKPDTQSDTIKFPCKNVRVKLRCDGPMSGDTGFGFDLEGDFRNAKFELIAPDWAGGTPVRYAARGAGEKNDIEFKLNINGDQTGLTARNMFTLQAASAASVGRFHVDGLKIDWGNSRAKNMLRGISITGAAVTTGNAAGATTDATGYAVGTTTIGLASAGTGSINAGDSIKFAGDPNSYVVTTGDADVSGGGSIVLAAPGLRVAIPASATAITIETKRFFNDLTFIGTLTGGFSSGFIFCDTTQRSQNIYAGKDFKLNMNAGVGLSLAVIDGGYLEPIVNSASNPLTLASTCNAIRIGDPELSVNGVPASATDNQAFVMASASRTTTQVDVTLTHSSFGSNFTVPTNARRMFTFQKADGTEIPITAAVPNSSTVLRLTLGSDPGASGNFLTCHDRRRPAALNGGAYGDQGDRVYDNSGYAARLKGGVISVA